MCPAKLELYIIYIYSLLTMSQRKNIIRRIISNITEETAGAGMFNIQMIELTVFADQSIEFLIQAAATESVSQSVCFVSGAASWRWIVSDYNCNLSNGTIHFKLQFS